MNEGHIYPADLDHKTPVKPEIRELWNEALKNAKSRRNKTVLKLFLSFFVLLGIAIFVGYSTHKGLGLLFFYSSLFLVVMIAGVLNLLIMHTFDYTVSEDRRSAQIEFKRVYQPISTVIKKRLKRAQTSASEDMEGCSRTVTIAVMCVFFFPLLPLIYLPIFVNRVIWLSDYKYLMSQWAPEPGQTKENSGRGTNIKPSVELAGSSPDSDDDCETYLEDSILRVFDNKLELFPDGKVACEGGVNFDAQAKIEGMTINGMTLTRTDRGLLRVHYEGADHAFFYNGSTWAKV